MVFLFLSQRDSTRLASPPASYAHEPIEQALDIPLSALGWFAGSGVGPKRSKKKEVGSERLA
jgi:hypothetical protein